MPVPKRYAVGGVAVRVGEQAAVEVAPRIFRMRLEGMHFDTDRAFLLPSAMTSIKRLKHFYDDHPGMQVLVVGHTDLRGDDAYNLSLSTERADAIVAFLRDQVDRWLACYEAGTPPLRRWGIREDKHMLSHLAGDDGPFYSGAIDAVPSPAFQDAVKRFQEWSNRTRGTQLTFTGTGPKTRRELVTLYMAEDETTLPAGTVLQSHGCGEHHPEIAQGGDVPENRRVEIFLFEEKIDPAPVTPCPSGGCAEQPIWLRNTVETISFEADRGDLTVTLLDADGHPIAGALVDLLGPTSKTTVTGPGGTADFHDLPPGDYRIETTRDGKRFATGTVTVQTGGRPNRVTVAPAAIDLLDAQDRVTDHVGVALFDRAFDPAGGAAGRLFNGATEATHFIGSDAHRFRIQVRDPAATGARIDVEWKTVFDAGGDDDAPASLAITCERTATGIYQSRGLMVVAHPNDKSTAANSGLTTGDVGDRNPGDSNHRLRLITVDAAHPLSSRVQVDYAPAARTPATAKVPVFARGGSEERRRIRVHLVNVRVSAGGAAVADQARLDATTMLLPQLFAVCGVFVEVTSHEIDPPAECIGWGARLAGVTLPAGSDAALDPTTFDPAVEDGHRDAAGQIVTSPSETALFTAVRAESWFDAGDLYICYVRRILSTPLPPAGPLTVSAGGVSFNDSLLPAGHVASGMTIASTVGADELSDAHEMGHDAGDIFHFEMNGPGAPTHPLDNRNLMKGFFIQRTPDVFDPRRVWEAMTGAVTVASQIQAVRSRRFIRPY